MRRDPLSIHDILLLTISALTLVVVLLVAQEVYVEWQKLEKIESLKQATLLSDDLFDATEKMSVERDLTFSMLQMPDEDSAGDLRPRLEGGRQDVDQVLQSALEKLKTYDFPEFSEQLQKTQEQFLGLQRLRREVDKSMASPVAQRDPDLSQRWFADATSLILQAQNLWMVFIKHYMDIDSRVALHMRFKHFLGIIMEYSGRQRSLIGRLIARNADPTSQEQAQLLQWQGMVELGWNISDTLADQSGLSPAVVPYLKDAKSHYFTVYDMVRDIFYVPGAHHGASYPVSVEFWLDLATQATDSLYALKDAALRETQSYVHALEAQAQRSIAYHTGLLLLALGLCFYTFRIVTHRVIRPVNTMIDALMNTTEGKPMPLALPDHNKKDEIGKLAYVLQVFQGKMEEMRQAAIMLRSYTHALERSNKELDDFAYIASHDLKEPLRGIHNHARFLLEDNQDKLDDDSVKRLGRLTHLSQRMERLVNDLLYFSRIGRQEPAIQVTDMNEVIHDIVGTLDVFLEEHAARIVIPRPLPTVTCDRTRISEAFRNLITNAIKYNDAADKIVEIGALEQAETANGAKAGEVFFVKDNGRGIAPEFHEEIFRIFKRLQNDKEEKDAGTGVGLTFVKKIIERQGGKIWLESQPGAGTTFYFTLKGEAYDTATTG